MKSVYRFTLALSVCLLLLVPVAVFAQTTGTVDGTVTDQSNAPLPGVTVELTSPNLQGTRTAVTSADGRYRFPAVPPGPYKVTAELAGFGKVEKRATVTLDATAQVNLSLQLSTTAEITVTGEAPMVDSTSTTQGTNYSAKMIDKLPVGRNYADVVFAQPGVQADFGETQGRSLAISIYGSTSSENLFLIDGVNTTNVIKGFQGKDINTEFIQEVEVKTGGYQAEYGRNTGGVVNVITKSGGNEFHGGVFGYYNDTGMRADLVNGEPEEFLTPEFTETGSAHDGANGPNYTFNKDVRQEWGADLGGFVMKDKIWFFGAYDRVLVNQTLTTLDVDNDVTFNQDFPISYFQNKYSGKLTFNLFQGTSIVGSVFSDSQTQEGLLFPRIPTNLNPVTNTGRRDTGGPDYAARLNQLFGSFGIFTFQYAQHKDRYTTKPFGLEVPQIRDFTVSANGTSSAASGGFGSVFGPTVNNSSTRESFAASFTGYVGNHEIKIGGDYQEDATFGTTYYTGGQRDNVRPCLQSGTSFCDLALAPFYDNGRSGAQHYAGPVFFSHDRFADGTPGDFVVIPGSDFNTPTKRYAGFIQDQWRIIPTLTLNVGVRYDSESFFGFDPDPEVGEFEAFKMDNQWSPRVGIVWDWAGDGTSKLYASAGRFYFSLPTDLNVRVFTANSQVVGFNYSPTDPNQADLPRCDEAGGITTGCVPRAQLFQGGNASGEPVDEGTKASYQDELTLGVEKALDPTLSIGLKGTYRTLGRTVEDRCDLDYHDPLSQGSTCALFNPGSDGVAASGGILSYNGCANPTNPNCDTFGNPGVAVGDAKRIFRGIEMVARKQFSNQLWAQASFLYSSLKGNYSGAIREASGQTDPGINADYDYYQFTFNDYGYLELDRPVQARVDAVYNAPFGLSAGLQFYVRSGLPVSRAGFFNNFYPDLLYLDQRGENTRTLSGDDRTPTDYDMNVSLSYNMNLGPVTVTPQVYLFNVLDRQTVVAYDNRWNPGASFVTDPTSPFFGEPGLAPGEGTCSAAAALPCTDNPDYMKAIQWTNPRLLRVALKVTF
jgi:outer membrane receptor protein involved in Fe transport